VGLGQVVFVIRQHLELLVVDDYLGVLEARGVEVVGRLHRPWGGGFHGADGLSAGGGLGRAVDHRLREVWGALGRGAGLDGGRMWRWGSRRPCRCILTAGRCGPASGDRPRRRRFDVGGRRRWRHLGRWGEQRERWRLHGVVERRGHACFLLAFDCDHPARLGRDASTRRRGARGGLSTLEVAAATSCGCQRGQAGIQLGHGRRPGDRLLTGLNRTHEHQRLGHARVTHGEMPPPHQGAALLARLDVQQVGAHGYQIGGVHTWRGIDAASGLEAWQPRPQAGVHRVHPFDHEPLVTTEAIEMLVFGGGVEETPVEVVGKVDGDLVERPRWEVFDETPPLGKARRERAEAGDAHLGVAGIDDVRETRAVVVSTDPDGILGERQPPEGPFVADAHAIERLGPTPTHPVAVDEERLVDDDSVTTNDGEAHAPLARLGPLWIGVAHDDHLGGEGLGGDLARAGEAGNPREVVVGAPEGLRVEAPHRPFVGEAEARLDHRRDVELASVGPEDTPHRHRTQGGAAHRPYCARSGHT